MLQSSAGVKLVAHELRDEKKREGGSGKKDRKSSEINFARKFVYYAPTTDKEVSSSLGKGAGESREGWQLYRVA